MNIEEFRTYCLQLPGTTEYQPFGPENLVMRAANKMFALLSLDSISERANLKCDPVLAVALREQYPDQVLPGYHMSKKHWNTIHYQHLPNELVQEWIQHSYDLVVASLTKKEREAYFGKGL